MKCSKCGNEIKDNAKFCNICGEKIGSENNQQGVDETENTVKDEGTVKAEVVEAPKKKNTTLMAIIGVALVLIVGIALASIVGESEDVDIVKKGYFLAYPEEEGYTDIGTAFENCFSDTSWESFTSEDGMKIVEFNGKSMHNGEEINCKIQFEVYDDDETRIYAMAFNDVSQDSLMIDILIEEIMEESWGK